MKMTPPTAKEYCSYCVTVVGRDKLKTCSRCRLVRYCSRNCQKEAWKTHKKSCGTAVTALPTNLTKPTSEHEAMWKALTRWLDVWSWSLRSWSMYSFNLPRHGRDRLSDNCFFLNLERRWGAEQPTQFFRLIEGAVVPRDQIKETLIKSGCMPEFVTNWENDRRGDDTIQVVVRADICLRLVWFTLPDAEARTNSVPDTIFDAIAERWPQFLRDAMERGDTSGSAHDAFAEEVSWNVIEDELSGNS